MTLSEFKAWFEAFTESMDGPPSHKQWERIQARVKEISGSPITERVFIDRYRGAWLDNHFVGMPHSRFGTTTCLNARGVTGDVGAVAFEEARIGGTELGANGHMARFDAKHTGAAVVDTTGWGTMKAGGARAFDSHSAMLTLGKAEAASLAA